MSPVISVENLSKVYRLGQIGTGTFTNDLKLWWARARGKPNPLLRIGQQDHGNRLGEDLWALRDVSFTVEQGEVLGIIGRNGAGKSTLLKILSRVTAPTSGRIRVKGRIASLLEVGTGFHPELTGRENVYLNGAILGMTRAEVDRKFDEIVAFAEVEKFIDTPVKRYSSGMYVRLAFAVAAHLEPEILVVDEVLAVGDAEFQKKALGKMGDVAKGGRTVLFVSHNLSSIQTLCDKGMLLMNGRVAKVGIINDVVTTYLDQIKHLSTIELTERDDGRDHGKIKLVRLDILSNNLYTKSLIYGEPVDFIFVLSEIKKETDCLFTIYDDFGQAVLHFSSLYKASNDKFKSTNNNSFICHVENLFLAPGKYRINVKIVASGFGMDHIEGATIFDVRLGQRPDRDWPLESKRMKILLPHQWIKPSENE